MAVPHGEAVVALECWEMRHDVEEDSSKNRNSARVYPFRRVENAKREAWGETTASWEKAETKRKIWKRIEKEGRGRESSSTCWSHIADHVDILSNYKISTTNPSNWPSSNWSPKICHLFEFRNHMGLTQIDNLATNWRWTKHPIPTTVHLSNFVNSSGERTLD